MTGHYAVRYANKRTRYYLTKKEAERAMARSKWAILWHWDGKQWKQRGMRVVFHADPSKDAREALS